MTILFATSLYWLRLVRLPIHIRLKQRYVGSSAMFIIGFGLVELWGRQRPADLSDVYAFGEMSGVLAVYLLSWSLLLATRARWLEPWFGGLDQMYLWHRRAAIVGMLLLVPHVLITNGAKPAGDRPSLPGQMLGVTDSARHVSLRGGRMR
jgi:predicted ferric reductase